MTTLDVAKKDFRDASRSKALWALTALFVLFLAGFAYIYTLLQTQGGNDPALTSLGLIDFLLSAATLLIPITALVVTYKSIAGEVESGSAKFLLSLPHTRRDAVIGKVLGRGAVLAGSIVVGLVVALVVVLALYDTFDPVAYLVFSALTVLLGVMYVAIGVGISSSTQDSGRAMILVVAFFLVFEIVWGFMVQALYYLLNGRFTPPIAQNAAGELYLDAPSWYFFVQRLSPSQAFATAVRGFTDSTATFMPAFDTVPVYLTSGASLLIMLGWLIFVPAVGYSLFSRADL